MDNPQKVMYAALGAPVLAGKRTVELGRKLAGATRSAVTGFGRSVADTAREQFTAAADEGEQVSRRVRKSTVVEELSTRLDLDEIQGRVDRLRDQVEDAIQNWREQFRPETRKETATKTETAKVATAPAAKKAPTKKATTAKTATTSAAKKASAPKAAAKKAAAPKSAAKKSTTARKTTTTKKASPTKS